MITLARSGSFSLIRVSTLLDERCGSRVVSRCQFRIGWLGFTAVESRGKEAFGVRKGCLRFEGYPGWKSYGR